MPKINKRGKVATEKKVELKPDNGNLNETYNVLAPVKDKGENVAKLKMSDHNSEYTSIEENGINHDDENEVVAVANEGNMDEPDVSPKRGNKSTQEQEPPSKKSRDVEKSDNIKSKTRGAKKVSPVKEDPESEAENGKMDDNAPEILKPKLRGRKKVSPAQKHDSESEDKNDEAFDEVTKPKAKGRKKAPVKKKDSESENENGNCSDEVAEVIKPKAKGRKKVLAKKKDFESEDENGKASDEEVPKIKEPKTRGRKKAPAEKENLESDSEHDKQSDEDEPEKEEAATKPKRGRKPKESASSKIVNAAKKPRKKASTKK